MERKVGMIVFSAKLSAKHQQRLTHKFPDEQFVFCQSPEEAKQYASDAEIYVTYGGDVNETLIQQAPKLKWIAVLSAGVDGFPFSLLQQREIIVTNARGIHAIQMSEYAISMLLQVYRAEKKFIENERNHVWDKTIRIREITGKTMVIVGTGAIGQGVARLAKAFQMKTIGISRSGKEKEHFDEVYTIQSLKDKLQEADFVISVIPSTKETKEIFTYEEFQAMPEHAVFLNMGRGDAVNEEDLLKAIREREIDHAILDVFQHEPLPEDHPFWDEEHITVTPHVAGLSPEYMMRALDIFEKNLDVYLKGENDWVNLVDLTMEY